MTDLKITNLPFFHFLYWFPFFIYSELHKMETLPRASYGFFSDYTKSLRLWFKTGYKSQLKGVELGKKNALIVLYNKHLKKK